jgi:predicted membrane channel-forming protein YqfA (hemolysin III family)
LLFFGLIIAFNALPSLPDIPFLKGGMTVLSLAIAGIFLGVFFLLRKRNRMAYYAALGLFAVTCLLLVFDDFGLVDFVVLVINLVPLGLLIKDRAWYLDKNP